MLLLCFYLLIFFLLYSIFRFFRILYCYVIRGYSPEVFSLFSASFVPEKPLWVKSIPATPDLIFFGQVLPVERRLFIMTRLAPESNRSLFGYSVKRSSIATEMETSNCVPISHFDSKLEISAKNIGLNGFILSSCLGKNSCLSRCHKLDLSFTRKSSWHNCEFSDEQ